MDAKTRMGVDATAWKYPSLLEDFQTAIASMAHMRHLASTARGFYCFCLTPSIRKLIRSICLIRGRIQSTGQELSTSQRISLWLQRSLFCTAIGSYFVLMVSCLPAEQTRRMWRVRQGSSLTWLSIRIRLQGRKPRESNKLFDLFFSYKQIRQIRPIRGKTKKKHPEVRLLAGLK